MPTDTLLLPAGNAAATAANAGDHTSASTSAAGGIMTTIDGMSDTVPASPSSDSEAASPEGGKDKAQPKPSIDPTQLLSGVPVSTQGVPVIPSVPQTVTPIDVMLGGR